MQSWRWDQAAFKRLGRHRCLITLRSSVIRRSDALEALLTCCVPPEWNRSELKLMVTSPSRHTRTHRHRGTIYLCRILDITSFLRSKNQVIHAWFHWLVFCSGHDVPHCSNEVNHLWFSAVGTYSQLHTEGNAEHLETLHLKVHPDGCFVVLLKKAFTKPHKHKTNAYRHSLARLQTEWCIYPLVKYKPDEDLTVFETGVFNILITHPNLQPGFVFGR